MRKVFFAILGLLLFTEICSQSLKGYTLGEKLVEPELKMTTVAGIKGGVAVQTLADRTIAIIMFIPSTDDRQSVARISDNELDMLKTGVEENYKVTFIKKEEEYTGNYTYYGYKNDRQAMFVIKVKHNQFLDNPNEIAFSITNKKLFDKLQNEEQEKANSDF